MIYWIAMPVVCSCEGERQYGADQQDSE